MPRELDPRASHEILTATPGAIYVDVRTPEEFALGHPAGAVNLPVMLLGAGGMRPNADFARVAEKVLARDVPLIVGCKSGQRSAMACQVLDQLGFPDTVNVAGGFHGMTDMLGRTRVAGWEACGLPSSTQARPGCTWMELRARADA